MYYCITVFSPLSSPPPFLLKASPFGPDFFLPAGLRSRHEGVRRCSFPPVASRFVAFALAHRVLSYADAAFRSRSLLWPPPRGRADWPSRLAVLTASGWVERGDASAGGKIVYSSTFDAVVHAGCEEDLNPTESSTALFNVAVSPAVNATVDGRLGCVLCVGSGPDKRQALFDACGEPAISGLLAAAEDKGFSLAVCGLLVFWERLYDLLDDARPIEGPPSASATGGGSSPRPLPGLLGATTRTVSSAADGAALIASLPALATKAEEDIVGAAVAGHLAVQLSLHDSATGEVVGRTLLVDVADATASAAAPSLLASTSPCLRHHAAEGARRRALVPRRATRRCSHASSRLSLIIPRRRRPGWCSM